MKMKLFNSEKFTFDIVKYLIDYLLSEKRFSPLLIIEYI